MSPDKILSKVSRYADNLEHFSRIGKLTNSASSYDIVIGRLVGEVSYCPDGWCDVLSSGLKRHYFSFGSVQDIKGQTIYNFTLWNISIIFGVVKK